MDAMRAMVGISWDVMRRMKSFAGDADDGLEEGLEAMLCDEYPEFQGCRKGDSILWRSSCEEFCRDLNFEA